MQIIELEPISQKSIQTEIKHVLPNFSLLFFCSPSLRRDDGSRIATPHSLLKEKFLAVGIQATAFAISNDCLIARVSDPSLLYERRFGETFRVSERLPEEGDIVRIGVKVTFANNGTGRKARTYGPEDCLEQFMQRSGVSVIPGHWPQVKPISNQYRQGITVSGIFQIEGRFELKSLERFCEALSCGVGARKSYGFGIINYDILQQ